jgi:hypothetical protein
MSEFVIVALTDVGIAEAVAARLAALDHQFVLFVNLSKVSPPYPRLGAADRGEYREIARAVEASIRRGLRRFHFDLNQITKPPESANHGVSHAWEKRHVAL